MEATCTRRKTATEVVVIVNARSSAASDAAAVLAAVRAGIRATGAGTRGVVTESEGELAQALADADGRRVALVGGDGSLHAALNAGVPLGEVALVPMGRANNVASALGIPTVPLRAARLAAVGTARPLDVLELTAGETRLICVEGVSAGLHADARAGYDGTNSADLAAGVRAFGAALRRYRPYPVSLEVDGRPVHEGPAAQVFLANLPLFAFGFRVNPEARPSDGCLEGVVIEAGSRREVVRKLAAAYRGTHVRLPGVTVWRGTTATLTAPLPLAGDGTPLGTATATVRVAPDRLRLVVPWSR